ncbi:hypothetical protein SAMN04488591_3119 [Microbacterium azadirachtae]|uniref:Uncharacterized protein n=1 Tax=Microbacterium azadirachtae TaxID=582680 RepID=A0A1I6IYI3_9MICO|nr:hypothetical protein [Microbacterium azadirachtae]SFR71753.1 hypothetical protein SAMN04488591_3119 [Microbacterium azadirachtae]
MNKATTTRSVGLAVGALALIAVSGFIGFGVGAQGQGAANAQQPGSASTDQYFEEVLIEIDLAGAKLKSEGPGAEQAATGKYREAHDA